MLRTTYALFGSRYLSTHPGHLGAAGVAVAGVPELPDSRC